MLLLQALLQLLLRSVAATPLRPVHLLPLVKGRDNKSSPKLRMYGAPNHIYRPRNHLFSMQSFFLHSARRQLNKQTKRIICLNDSTFPYKRNQNETIMLYCHIPYVRTVSCGMLYPQILCMHLCGSMVPCIAGVCIYICTVQCLFMYIHRLPCIPPCVFSCVQAPASSVFTP